MIPAYAYVAAIVLFVLLEGFFAGTETGLVSINRLKLLREKRRRSGSLLRTMMTHPERVLGVTLIGTNVCVVTASALCSDFFEQHVFPHSWYHAFFWSTGVITLLILVFGELIPKTLFRIFSTALTLPAARALSLLSPVLFPIAHVFTSAASGIIRLLGLEEKPDREPTTEELKALVDMSARQGILDETARGYIQEIFDLSDTIVREVMIPLVDIVSIRRTSSIQAAIRLFRDSHFFRIPVFDKRVYNMLGYISLSDFLRRRRRGGIEPLVRETIYVPETKKIDELFVEMQKRRLPLVFVVDEHGGVSGLVTMEDVVEEIVGEIRDPDEPAEETIVREPGGVLLVSGDVSIDELREDHHIPLDKHGYDTVAGFVLYRLGEIPKAGVEFGHRGFLFSIVKATERSVERIRISPAKKARRRRAKRAGVKRTRP